MSTLEFWSEAVRLGPNERVRGATNARKMQKWRFHGKVHHVQRSRSPPPVLARQKIASVEFATFDASSARSEEPVETPEPSRQRPARRAERDVGDRRATAQSETAMSASRRRRTARLSVIPASRLPTSMHAAAAACIALSSGVPREATRRQEIRNELIYRSSPRLSLGDRARDHHGTPTARDHAENHRRLLDARAKLRNPRAAATSGGSRDRRRRVSRHLRVPAVHHEGDRRPLL